MSSNLGYGYKLKINLVSPYNTNSFESLERTIFVPAKKVWVRMARITDDGWETWSECPIKHIYNYEEPEITKIQYVNADDPNKSIDPAEGCENVIVYYYVLFEKEELKTFTTGQWYNKDMYYSEWQKQWNIPTELKKQYYYSNAEPDENSNWVDTPIYCGYYQIPKNIKVSDISLFDQAQATIDYKVHFDLNFLSIDTPKYWEAIEYTTGQINGTWRYGENISPLLKGKYYAKTKENDIVYEYCLDSWYLTSFDGEEQDIRVKISTLDNPTLTTYFLDKQGLYTEKTDNQNNLIKEYVRPNPQINQCIILGTKNSDAAVDGFINYQAYIMQKTYV